MKEHSSCSKALGVQVLHASRNRLIHAESNNNKKWRNFGEKRWRMWGCRVDQNRKALLLKPSEHGYFQLLGKHRDGKCWLQSSAAFCWCCCVCRGSGGCEAPPRSPPRWCRGHKAPPPARKAPCLLSGGAAAGGGVLGNYFGSEFRREHLALAVSWQLLTFAEATVAVPSFAGCPGASCTPFIFQSWPVCWLWSRLKESPSIAAFWKFIPFISFMA